jgi:hypothetical protein
VKKLLVALGLAGSLGLAIALPWAWATTLPITYVGNANYQMLNSDKNIVPNVALTTNRTWTLPYAGGTNITSNIDIIDAQGNIGGANSCIVIAPQSGDTINGSSSSITFCGTYGKFSIFPISGTNWTYSVVAAGQLAGTTTNDNASAGNVGEFITASKNLANARQATTNSSTTITSVALTPGDWDCTGIMSQSISSTTTVQALSASLGGTDGVIGTQGTDGVTTEQSTEVSAILYGANGRDLRVGPVRESLSGNTTIYLVSGASFLTSQLWTYGDIRCRRAR